MEQLEQLVPFVLFILLVLGGSVLKWYIEKQQAGKKAAERQAKRTGQQPPPHGTAGGRGTFYDRPAERRAEAPPQEPVLPEQAIAPPQPVAAPPRAPTATGAVVAGRVIQQKTQRRAASALAPGARAAPARAQEKPGSGPLGKLEQRRLEVHETAEVGTLRRKMRTEAPAPPVPTAAPGFLGNMLRGKHVACAIVLSEILGPPKGLRGF